MWWFGWDKEPFKVLELEKMIVVEWYYGMVGIIGRNVSTKSIRQKKYHLYICHESKLDRATLLRKLNTST